MTDFLDNPRHSNLLALAGAVLGAAPFAWAIATSVADRHFVAGGTLTLVSVAGGIALWPYLHRRVPTEVIETTVFRPFLPMTAAMAWQRPDDVRRVSDTLLCPGHSIPLIVGPSGVGKTTLLTLLVANWFATKRPNVTYSSVSSYATLERELEKRLANPVRGQHYVIVLDQFEQWLARNRARHAEEQVAEQEWLTKTLTDAVAAEHYTIALSLRKEWFYDLAFLGSLVPGPAEICGIQGPQIDNVGNEMRNGILESLTHIFDDARQAEVLLEQLGHAGRVSPLEAQIVGATLEKRVARGEALEADKFDTQVGGVDGAIAEYFGEILSGAEQRTVCVKLLYALSVRTRFREQVEVSQLLRGLFEEPDEIRQNIEYLETRGLLVRRGKKAVELTHDYLAEYFNAQSGQELNPIERDNIAFHADGSHGVNPAVLAVDSATVKSRKPWGKLIVKPMIVLMIVRLGYFGVNWTLIGPSVAQPARHNLIDAAYLIIFVPYLGWMRFVGNFYDRIFRRLDEGPVARAFSMALVFNLVLGIVIGSVVPFAWLFVISEVGLLLGIKLMLLSRREDLNPSARDRLRRFGMATLGNLFVVFLLGVADLYVSFTYVHSASDAHTWLALNVVAAIVMTYGFLELAPIQVSRSGASQLLGLVGRAQRIRVTRPES